jgi:hypothetical protein
VSSLEAERCWGLIGSRRNSRPATMMGWLTTAVMAAADFTDFGM